VQRLLIEMPAIKMAVGATTAAAMSLFLASRSTMCSDRPDPLKLHGQAQLMNSVQMRANAKATEYPLPWTRVYMP
jgi:hypothetical protein